MNTETKPFTRGGARKGAGRKPGKTKRLMTFSLPISTTEALAAIPNKSQFVNQAIEKALHRL
jgi:hypothetical protein